MKNNSFTPGEILDAVIRNNADGKSIGSLRVSDIIRLTNRTNTRLDNMGDHVAGEYLKGVVLKTF